MFEDVSAMEKFSRVWGNQHWGKKKWGGKLYDEVVRIGLMGRNEMSKALEEMEGLSEYLGGEHLRRKE